MKKILLLLTLISLGCIAQNNPAQWRNGIETKFIALDTLTTAQRDALTLKASKGYVIFNADTNVLNVHNGSSWSGIAGDLVDNTAYNEATWNGIETVAPSKDAVRDKFVSIDALIASSGNVTKVGTPLNNQIAIWTGDGIIEGDTGFTFDGSQIELNGTGSVVFQDIGQIDVTASSRTWTIQPATLKLEMSNLGNTYTLQLPDNTVSRTATFPDKTGTVAFLDDISGGTVDVVSNVATQTILGRNTAGSGDSEELTPTQAKTILALENVDNTSDVNKPVSTAQQTAIDGKINNDPYASWDTNTTEAPSADALHDKIESLILGVGTGATPISHTFAGSETNYDFGTTITDSHQIAYGTTTSDLVLLQEGVSYTKSGSVVTFVGFTASANDVIVYYPNVAVPATYDAADVDVAATPTNYTPATPDVEAHLVAIDTALGSASSSTTLEANLTITNPTIASGVSSHEIVAAQGAGKVIMIESFSAFSTGGAAATGNTTISGRYSGLGGNSLSAPLIMSAAGGVYGVNGMDDIATSGDLSNRSFNIVVLNTVDQSLTVTIHVKIRYTVADTTTGF